MRWRDLGFPVVHVVDLDAASGRGDNAELVRAICAIDALRCQVGGGVRSDEAAAALLDAGAWSVIVGTRAVEDPAWLAALAHRHPGSISVAADVRDGALATHGWTVRAAADPTVWLTSLEDLALAQVLVTAIDVEGSQRGPALDLVAALRAATAHRLGIAGGIATAADLDSLRSLGVDAAIIGTALYTGALDPRGLSEEHCA
jgi:phosphoribosylformimino-5-aminoimidazole carboxamide ribotide isomerase